MRLTDIKIGHLLATAFATGSLALLLTVAIAIAQMAAIQKRLDSIVKENNLKTQSVNQLKLSLLHGSEAIRTLPLLQDEQLMAEQKRKFEASAAEYASAAAALRQVSLTSSERAALTTADSARATLSQLQGEIIKLALDGRMTEATDLIINREGAAHAALYEQLTNMQDSGTAEAYQGATSARQFATTILIALGVVALVASALAAWLVTRAVTKPLGEAVKMANQVAEGDLRGHITASGRSETGALLGALALMNNNLANVVSSVRAGAGKLSAAATQVYGGSTELSERTEASATSLEQTTASMEQLGAAVARNTEHAKQAASLAKAASDTAQRGGQAFGDVVNNMNAIDNSAKRIFDIIGVMDGITFQTNILALNAAVEAARAGDHGRGFAVVASEVRALAQRSATAAKEIKALIGDSTQRIEAGSRAVRDAAATMDQIVAANRDVSKIINEIALGSVEQRDGIEQVKGAISQLDSATQRNGALVQQLSAATDLMKGEALRLAKGVDFFKVGGADNASVSVEQWASESRPTALRHAPRSEALRAPKTDEDSDWQTF
jgi:methyl-accepting chemotaxis protein